jgi:excisionase family DNA binding protein
METGATTIKSFCERYSISDSQAYEEIANGRLRAVKLGRKTLIPHQAASDWLAALPALDLAQKRSVA